MEGLVSLLPLVGIALLFWLLIIRPQSRRVRETQQLQSSVEVGDQVILTSGFFGTVVAMLDDRLELRLADDVVVTVARGAIGSIVRDDEASEGYEDESYQQPGDEPGDEHPSVIEER